MSIKKGKIKMRYAIVPNETKVGIVKAVHDGDSIKVKFDDGEVSWIRLYGCDAPEVVSNHVSTTQPYGVESGNFLRDLVKGWPVTVHTLFRDQYQRMICKVEFEIPSEEDNSVIVDLSVHLIENGMAWWLSEPSQTQEDLDFLKSVHDFAKQGKIGLWGHDGRKLRPSTWRSRNRRPAGFVNDPELW